jgi:hypothetical protein
MPFDWSINPLIGFAFWYLEGGPRNETEMCGQNSGCFGPTPKEVRIESNMVQLIEDL